MQDGSQVGQLYDSTRERVVGACEDLDYDLHQIAKEQVSSSDSLIARRERREWLNASTHPEIQRLMAGEAKLRKGIVTEPASHPCVSAFSVGKRLAGARSPAIF